MELYVDAAKLETIQAIGEVYPIDGFTTNPKILATADGDVREQMQQYRTYVQKANRRVFMQVTASRAEDMAAQAEKMSAYFGPRFVVKLPAVKEGYRAIALCKEKGIDVCITVVHAAMQGIIAAKAGADYVAPYISHIDNHSGDGVRCVSDMLDAFQHMQSSCKVLGASFRTVAQIRQLAVVGCDAVTLAPDLFDALIAHPATLASMQGFECAWIQTFGTQHADDLISG